MENLFFFRPEEQTHLKDLYRSLLRLSGKVLKPDDCANLKNYLVQAGLNNFLKRDVFDLNPIITDMEAGNRTDTRGHIGRDAALVRAEQLLHAEGCGA